MRDLTWQFTLHAAHMCMWVYSFNGRSDECAVVEAKVEERYTCVASRDGGVGVNAIGVAAMLAYVASVFVGDVVSLWQRTSGTSRVRSSGARVPDESPHLVVIAENTTCQVMVVAPTGSDPRSMLASTKQE
ncbi:hypothetical protein V8B97DRAFT_1914256 [Scleroderma yunnanense]